MHTLAQLKSGELKGTSHLKLSCGLKAFPQEIFELADTLEKLDLSGNQLSSLPEDFGRLSKLKIVFFSDNLFTELPEVLSQCPLLEMIGFKSNQIELIPEKVFTPQLRWLILTNNKVKVLPKSIGQCVRLQKCALAGNRIKVLPEEMKNCRNLELLRISANQIEILPEWLLHLPKLSWLAFSGNPCADQVFVNQELREIEFLDLELQELLGEGASGHISKAIWKGDTIQNVAVKVFKGDVTSDGLPIDEMNACITAGEHECLIKVIGKIKNHSENKQGLVLELISPTYKNLGNPPSLVTCTRDTFANGTLYALEQIIKIATGIASVANHLHKNGISHGDLYAHNILIDSECNVILGDFGAATYYSPETKLARLVQAIEVRAFGCLLDDLLNLLTPNEITKYEEELAVLTNIRNACFDTHVQNRPNLDNIYQQVSAINLVIK